MIGFLVGKKPQDEILKSKQHSLKALKTRRLTAKNGKSDEINTEIKLAF